MTWVSPTGHVDGAGTWNNEANAYDGNTGTGASGTLGTSYLELTIAAIQCDKVRLYHQRSSPSTNVVMEVYYSAAWHDISVSSFPDGDPQQNEWFEYEIGSVQSVTAARLKLSTTETWTIYEFEFNDRGTWKKLAYADDPPAAHKDSHDPNDGADPLDTANAAEISAVVAAGTGTSHSLARADHVHAISHAITDNHLLTVDDAAAADNDFARFTADGIEGLTVAEAITALFGAALPENVGITLDAALSADEKFSGIVEDGTAGATVDFGDLLYHDVTAGEWLLAKADAAATSAGKLGINVTVAQKADGEAITVLLWGKVRSDGDYNFTVDAPVFISAATAGDMTSTAPSGTTNFVVRIVGYGNTADELFFCPDKTYLELA